MPSNDWPREEFPQAHRPSPTAAPASIAALWPLYIFLRPRRFYESLALVHTRSLTFACVMVFGVSHAMGRAESNAARIPALASSWSTYWGVVAVGGTLAAAVTLVIGGWWYRTRLRWSGVETPDKAVSNRVYVSAAQVFAMPNVIVTACAAPFFATPLDWFQSDASMTWALLLLPLILYSFVVSYIGVRTVFDARPWPARIWFLALPVALILGVFGLAVLAALAIQGAPSAP